MIYEKYIKELEDLINEESQTHELKKIKTLYLVVLQHSLQILLIKK